MKQLLFFQNPAQSAAKAPATPAASRRVIDWLTRLAHWVLAFSFTGAFITAEMERFRQVHVVLGYTVVGVVLVRALWGLVGPRPARLSVWSRKLKMGPTLWANLREGKLPLAPLQTMLQAFATLSLLVLALLATASGYATYESLAGEWVEDVHEAMANAMLFVVVAHVALVGVASVLRRQNQAMTMVTGKLYPWGGGRTGSGQA
jgi:cytochrome b